MRKQSIEFRDQADTHQTVSLFRALIVFGMLGYGTFFGVTLGLFSHYFLQKGGSLIVSLVFHVVVGWCLGLVVGWQKRTTLGARGPKR